MLEDAIELHRQGRLGEAEQAYRAILAREPENAEVGHRLGLLALDAGMPEHAASVFEQVCRLAPANAVFHVNRGISYMRNRRVSEAMEAFDRAIALQPGLFEAHVHRGVALKEMGRVQEALESVERALALRGDDAAALNLRGLMLDELGRYEEAADTLRGVLAANQSNPMAHSNYAHALVRLRRHAEAIPHYEKAVAIAPDMAGLHYNLAEPLKAEGRIEEALAAYDRAIALEPELVNAHVNRALLLTHLGRSDEALAAADYAIGLEPDSTGARMARSGALVGAGRIEEALAYDRELARNPQFRSEADFHSAMLLLARDGWEEGWKFYEARRGLNRYLNEHVYPVYSQPEWLGDGALAGKTLYVHGEQGLGDHIQFARYLSLARRAGANVIFGPRSSLARLFAGQDLADTIQPWQTPPAQFDLHAPLASLPLAFGTRPDTVPADIPYLRAEPALVEKWRERIGAQGMRIGICWAGAYDPIQGADRSFPLAALAGLAALPGVRLISLQKVNGMEQLADLPAGMTVEQLGDDFDSGSDAFVDTAAAMQSLDLIVSCDTATAHLAGALGRPVWTALKRNPEWRWGDDGETSPWYPTMTLFRQSKMGDWDGVFAAMRERLAAQLAKA